MESALNGMSFALLLTSLYVLRFRGWRRPFAVLAYFVFFVTLEVTASHYLLPPGAFGPVLMYLCLFLTLPVMVATFLVWKHEQRHGEGGD